MTHATPEVPSSCCQSNSKTLPCHHCGVRGKPVSSLTLKSLLVPEALTRLKDGSYYFCGQAQCPVVYFDKKTGFKTHEIKVPVFQKTESLDCPVCYCLGITRGKMIAKPELVSKVKKLTHSGECECAKNNPQGSCCLGNISPLINHRK